MYEENNAKHFYSNESINNLFGEKQLDLIKLDVKSLLIKEKSNR